MIVLIASLAIAGVGCSKSNNKSEQEIKSTIESYNETLRESYFGKDAENSEELFVDKIILGKANWRSMFISLLYSQGEITEVEQSIDYSKIEVKDDFAKAVTDIKMNIVDKNNKETETFNRKEAYLLKNVDGKWKIHSIFEAEHSENKERNYKDFVKSKDFEKYGDAEGNIFVGDDKSKNIYEEKFYIWMEKIHGRKK